jgi:hypothetical protein
MATIAQLIDYLQQFDPDTPVYLLHTDLPNDDAPGVLLNVAMDALNGD